MRRTREGCSCGLARFYYFDYLVGSCREAIPPDVAAHIRGCRSCQKEIARLQGELQAESDRRAPAEQTFMADLLEQHFRYVSDPVDCSLVRAFLPGLADDALSIRIPTPITVHMDQCEDCRLDLMTIRSWSLGPGQSYRLSRLLANAGQVDEQACDRIAAPVDLVARLDVGQVDPAVLAHIGLCDRCQTQMYRLRQVTLSQLELEGDLDRGGCGSLDCQHISEADLFDLVVPSGLVADQNPYARFLGPVSAHVRGCRRCLGRLVRIHRDVHRMLSRPQSGVVTCYQLQPGPSHSGRRATASPAGPAKRVWARGLWGLVGTAAAVILAAGLWSLIPNAHARPLSKVWQAFGSVRCTHIVSRMAECGPVVQEFWMDRGTGLCLGRLATGAVLWDTASRVTKVIGPDGGLVEQRPMDRATLEWASHGLATGFGLMPFGDTASVPASSTWDLVQAVEGGASGLGVYELVWPAGAQGQMRKWKVSLSGASLLPLRAEYYTVSADGSKRLETIMTAEYLTAEQFQAALQAMMGQSQ